MQRKKIDFDIVREIARALPDVEESILYGVPALKLRGRLFVCQAIHKSAEPNSLVVRVGFEERAKLLASEPGVYYLTAHYVKHPAVLVRLAEISHSSLRDLLHKACHSAIGTTRKSGRKPARKRS
jgi:hypothetical protein